MFNNKYVVNIATSRYCADATWPPQPAIYRNVMMITKNNNRPQLKIENSIRYGL